MPAIVIFDTETDPATIAQTLRELRGLTPTSVDELVQVRLVAHRLSPREQEILLLDRAGLSRGSIARRFSIAERTIETHWRNIYIKLDLFRREEVRQWLANIYQECVAHLQREHAVDA